MTKTFEAARNELRAVWAKHWPTGTPEKIELEVANLDQYYAFALAQRAALTLRGTQPALDNLLAVNRHLIKAAEIIGASFKADEDHALSRVHAPTNMVETLSTLNEHIVRAYRELENEPEATAHPWRPKEVVAEKVADYAAGRYEILTGRALSRSISPEGKGTSDFHQLLEGIFNAFEIKANVDHQVRRLMEERS